MKSRIEQKRLEEEIKDVRDQNSKLKNQVNKSSVQTLDEAYKKQKELKKRMKLQLEKIIQKNSSVGSDILWRLYLLLLRYVFFDFKMRYFRI